jgi:acetoin utilization deacetylase AcuC-like enzyme
MRGNRESATREAKKRIMTTALLTHEDCFLHEPPPGHPERPARLSAVLTALTESPVLRLEAPQASREALIRSHTPSLVNALLGAWNEGAHTEGLKRIDADTVMSRGSAEAALRAAGAAIAAVDGIMARAFDNAFCAVRPPGHHAERGRAMGFCLFNNVAVSALHARARYGLKRIAVVDFDVHHGNGTQDIFWAEPDLFYASTHQMPLYPGSGFANERGGGDNIVNCPLSPGSGSAEFRAVYLTTILPALERFMPDFIFISAGFDAHRADPLANLDLTAEDFGWVTAEICRVAARVCEGRVVSLLEGGYDLDALAASTAAHVQALMEA